MLNKYPSPKKLVFVLDNLWAHKSSLIVDLIKEHERVHLLLTPSNTPEFSPIGNLINIFLMFKENLFGFTKRKLQDFEFERGIKGK